MYSFVEGTIFVRAEVGDGSAQQSDTDPVYGPWQGLIGDNAPTRSCDG